MNLVDLTDKRILITGASSGIGRACAIRASELGAQCVIVARRQHELEQTLSQMQGEGHVAICSDLSSGQGVADLVAKYDFQNNRINGLVHSAGLVGAIPLRGLCAEELQRMMSINFVAYVLLCKQFTRKAYSADGASFVGISSTAAQAAWNGGTAYCASKAALDASTRVMALEYARNRRLRFNTVSPSYVRTATVESSAEAGIDVDEFVKKMQPLGFGLPVDVANAVCFLLSDAARFITGVSLPIDGGYLAQ